jgi:hypothetical protein
VAAPYSITRVLAIRARLDERGIPNRNTGTSGKIMASRRPLVIVPHRLLRK